MRDYRHPDRPGKNIHGAEYEPDRGDPRDAAGALVAVPKSEGDCRYDNGGPCRYIGDQVPEHEASIHGLFDDTGRY